ncbi:MAG: ImmA/IrrE family metallo-endopeptidase, partial [Tissierellia bacterium]|nr:ImmA/IrrE family metallo-endopeptidase [Tissierellia bacterium]
MINNNINIPDELFRLEIKELAEEIRIKFAKKGLSDIFDILSNISFLIRKPLDIEG